MRKISDLLKETREEKELSLDNVESTTKIKKEFLLAIENGQFHKLPSESYALGFVKNYSKYLGISLSRAIPLFKRENQSKHSFYIVPEFRKKPNRFNRNLFFSSKFLLLIASIFLIGAYIIFQYSSLFFPPPLEINTPKNGSVFESNVVEIKGKTDPYSTVFINDDETYVDISGEFQKSLYAFSGDNKIEIIAKNRFGKETRKVVTVKIQ